MRTFKTKIIDVNVGKYDVDSIIVNIDNKKTEICFSKDDNISQYLDKEVNIIEDNGKYKIDIKSEIKSNEHTYISKK